MHWRCAHVHAIHVVPHLADCVRPSFDRLDSAMIPGLIPGGDSARVSNYSAQLSAFSFSTQLTSASTASGAPRLSGFYHFAAHGNGRTTANNSVVGVRASQVSQL